jgi:hypothetical protein
MMVLFIYYDIKTLFLTLWRLIWLNAMFCKIFWTFYLSYFIELFLS